MRKFYLHTGLRHVEVDSLFENFPGEGKRHVNARRIELENGDVHLFRLARHRGDVYTLRGMTFSAIKFAPGTPEEVVRELKLQIRAPELC